MLGGGIGGLSAALGLLQRGFDAEMSTSRRGSARGGGPGVRSARRGPRRARAGQSLEAPEGVLGERGEGSGGDEPRFSGMIAWRGVNPMAALPPHVARMVGTNWVGPGAHVIHYPLRRGELMNFVGIVERSDWRIESWSTRGSDEE